MSQKLFNIHAPGIDTRELLDRIETEVSNGNLSTVDARRVLDLNLAPDSPANELAFDAALTSELFERPMPAPDLKSTKYRWVQGPLRVLAEIIYKRMSQLFDRLSRNKTQAFYNVVHELIALRHRQELLELSQHDTLLTLHNSLVPDKKIQTISPPAGIRVPELPIAIKTFYQETSQSIQARGAQHVALLDDHFGHMLHYLRKAGVPQIYSHSMAPRMLKLHQPEIGLRVVYGNADPLLLDLTHGSIDTICVLDLARYSGSPELLGGSLAHVLRSGGQAILLYNTGLINSGLQQIQTIFLDLPQFQSTLEQHSFKVHVHAAPSGLKKDSRLLILDKP